MMTEPEHPADLLARGETDEGTIREAHASLMGAMLEFNRKAPNLKLGKDSSGQVAGNRTYKYLSLDKLMDEVRPLLTECGLVWVTQPEHGEDGPVLTYRLVHVETGQEVAGIFPLMIDKQNSQGLGSAITYGRRYALTAVLGIVPDEDDDGAKASATERAVSARPKPSEEVISDEQRTAMTNAIKESGLDLADTLEAAKIYSLLSPITVSQARRVRKMIDAAKEGEEAVAAATEAGHPEGSV